MRALKPVPEYEETLIRLDRFASRSSVRLLLTQHAEYGGWELRRLRKYPDGTRQVWLRRRVVGVSRTF